MAAVKPKLEELLRATTKAKILHRAKNGREQYLGYVLCTADPAVAEQLRDQVANFVDGKIIVKLCGASERAFATLDAGDVLDMSKDISRRVQ